MSAACITLIASSACGGPEGIDPIPPQSVNSYWVGVEQNGNVHLHITLTQSGTSVGLLAGCQGERCSFYPFTQAGADAIGSTLPVHVSTASGTFNNPNINFSFTLANGRSYAFSGRVAEDRLMQGQISGTGLASSTITFEKRQ